jgi:hypothetical protein
MFSILAATAPPAGGTPIGEVLAAAGVASIAMVAVVVLGIAHRRNGFLQPIATLAERRTGLPAWATIPGAITSLSLVVAVWGYYWDVSWHIDRGRDPGAFANPAHWFIIVGLDGIAFAGVLAFFLGDGRSPSAVRLTDKWSVPAGAFLLGACGLIALAGFPLDDIWHRLFGQDVTAWGPTHIQMIGGASLATLGAWALSIEGRRAAGDGLTPLGRRMVRFEDISLAGAFLVGLSTLQVEFDFGVPQFRLIEQPVLLALAAGIGLVAARIRAGRGAALYAAAFFIVVRGLLALGVGAMGRTVPHFPLYLVEALLVEGIALVIKRERQVTLGAVAGFAIGTVGFGAEWVWTRLWMPYGWTADLIPLGLVLAAMAGTAGGVLGGLVGRALSYDIERQRSPRFAAGFAWLGAVAAIAIALPMTAHHDWKAQIHLEPVAGSASPQTAFVAVRLDPPGIEKDASWFDVLSWQGAHDTGGNGGAQLTHLVRQSDGSYRTAKAVPISGTYKTMLRLQSGTSLQSIAIYMPADAAIPVGAVAAKDGTHAFVADKHNLQREARTDHVNLERLAYVLLALVAVLWMVVISWGLRRIESPRPGSARLPGWPTTGLGRRPAAVPGT